MKNRTNIRGFTMVELMVSVGLTAVLMLGIATFFSGTFQNMFIAREKVANTQGQFVVNTIVGGKFVNVTNLEELNSDSVVIRNDMNMGDLPFTYVASDSGHVVFKDFFVFNGKDGISSSYGSPGVDNPGGITFIGADKYITAPLEDDIYYCSPIGLCSPMGVIGLDQPIDITDDDSGTLYVTDAGNNRIVKIENLSGSKKVTPIVSDLNYPTGIEYHKPGGTAYLFVSDTYNHFVKKVDVDTPANTEVVVGEGDNADCDGTALYCKLNFPTGLMVNNNELYIADTGNERVLKVSDPGKPENFTFVFDSPSTSEAIKEIKLIFPVDTDLTAAAIFDKSSVGDFLQTTGSSSKAANEFTYELWTELSEDTLDTNACTEPCTPSKNKIRVVDDNLFNSTQYNSIYMANESLTVGSKAAGSVLNLTGNFANHQSSGTPVVLTTEVPADTEITFEFEFADTTAVTSGFKVMDIEFWDEDNLEIESRQDYVRIGDDELGTPEDVIEDVGFTYNFPTGLGWNTGALQVSNNPQFDASLFLYFDYVSEFEVNTFTFANPNGGDILELTFDAKLGEDSEGTPIWEDYTLNADVK